MPLVKVGVPVEATTNIHDGVCELNADEQEVMSKGSLRPEVAVMRKREVILARRPRNSETRVAEADSVH